MKKNNYRNHASILCGAVATLLVAAAAYLKAAGVEVWISPATPANTSASGTPNDPYKCPDASSLKTVLTDTSKIPPSSCIHFLPGTFNVTNGIVPLAGWKLRGAGIDVTTLKFTPGQSGIEAAVVGATSGYVAKDGVEVSDMTVDCNLQAQTNFCTHAVSIAGNNTRISRVRAINWGTTTSNNECFVLNINSHSQNGAKTNCVIEDCVVEQAAPVTHARETTAITIFNGLGLTGQDLINSLVLGSEIRGCVVSGVTAGTGGSGSPTAFHAYGAGYRHVTIHNNRAVNLLGNYDVDCSGVYSENGDSDGITIANNVFENVLRGIYFNAASGNQTRMKVLNNVLMPAEGGVGIQFNGNGDNNTNLVAREWIIKDNVVHPHRTATNVTAFYVTGGLRAMVLNNVFQGAGTGFDVELYGSNAVSNFRNTFSGNVNLSGGMLTGQGSGASATGPHGIGYEDTIRFTVPANSNGWYRLLSVSSQSAGLVEIHGGTANGLLTDLEFSYRARAYTSNSVELGDLILTRQGSYYKCCGYYSGGTVTKARIGSDYVGTVYLDIYIEASSSTPDDYIIVVRGFDRKAFLAAPQRVTLTPTVVKETIFNTY